MRMPYVAAWCQAPVRLRRALNCHFVLSTHRSEYES
jgi:hypothetical protein